MTDTSERKKGLQKYYSPFFQYLFSPILILIIGAAINHKVSKAKEELQKIELAQRMLIDIFGQEDAVKGMVLVRLMDKVLDDKDLYDELSGIMNDYYTKKLQLSLENGHTEEADKILAAAESVGGEPAQRILDVVKNDERAVRRIEKYRQAKVVERIAYKEVLKGNYQEAASRFREADSIYPDFKQAQAISRIIKERLPELEDNPEAQRQVEQELIMNSRDAPADLVDDLKQKTQRTVPD